MNALKKEEQINRDEADAWVHAGQWNKEHGHEDTAAKIFEKSAEYDDKADAAREQWIAKEKEYNDAKTAMSETSKQAYGDDAMFDAYTSWKRVEVNCSSALSLKSRTSLSPAELERK